MSMQDPIADMLTRIRNAGSAGLKKVEMPSSKEKAAIAKVLKEEGYISDFAISEDGVKRQLTVELKYVNGKSVIDGIERVSKPSCRVHCGSREIPRVRNGLGTVILTTPSGVLSGRAAAKANVGGEILCYVW
ncbi:MAG: 30S ribosomal protein S8 [Victivallales bacterium]|nr:30S ribosomal protein S8 [Victivallales bacterium]